jgi:hypothetical protein
MVKRSTHNRRSDSSILSRPTRYKYSTMEQKRKPVEKYYYSEQEWDRLGCGPLPPERDRGQTHQDAHAKGNPKIDGKAVKGYN